MDATIIIAIIGLLGVVSGGIITGLFLHKKNNADADKTASDAWRGFAEKMEQRVTTLETKTDVQEKKITRLGQRIIFLMQGIEILIEQIQAKGESPCWQPDDWTLDE